MRRPVSFATVAILGLALVSSGQPRPGTMYTAVWPNDVLILDEATGAIQNKIPLKNGAAFSLTMSPDRKKFYAVTALMEGLEVIDIASRRVEEAFTLSSGNRKVRLMRNVAAHPDGVRVFAPVRIATKEIDRYTLDKPMIATIDVREKKITKTLELPKDVATNALMKVSPDGKFIYFFFRDILVIDVEQFKIVDKIEMNRPVYPGMGNMRLGGSYEAYDSPNTLTFMYNSVDPASNRQMMGFATFNAVDRSIDFFETNPSLPLGGFAVTPDNKRAYAVRGTVGQYEFYVFDLEGKRVLKKLEYEGRPRTSIKVSSDGKKFYLHNAGNTIDYYNAETLTFEKRVELPGDFTANLFIVPR